MTCTLDFRARVLSRFWNPCDCWGAGEEVCGHRASASARPQAQALYHHLIILTDGSWGTDLHTVQHPSHLNPSQWLAH